MENKYIAVVYAEDMSDILKQADILGTFTGMRADSEGKYVDMDFYEIGFDYKIWKQLREARASLEYIDKDGNAYSLVQGRCNNLNEKVKIKEVVAKELEKVEMFKNQKVLRDKYMASGEDAGIVEYTEKKTNAVANKKAMSLIAYDKDSDLVMPFREIINGTEDSLPIFVYLHDKKSRGSSNTTLLLKECKNIIAALKASGQNYIMIIPNVVTGYGIVNRVDGRKKLTASSLDTLLARVIDYEVETHGGDRSRVYVMGNGTGVVDALTELYVNNEKYAGAILSFGEGWYPRDIDNYKNIKFEVVSASDDYDYEDEYIAGMAEDIKAVGADVNYTALDGTLPVATKEFFKDTTWLTNIFEAKRGYSRPAPAKSVEAEVTASAEEPKSDKPVEAKPAEDKPADSKPVEDKPAETKPADKE